MKKYTFLVALTIGFLYFHVIIKYAILCLYVGFYFTQ